jgi:hypothetical protein
LLASPPPLIRHYRHRFDKDMPFLAAADCRCRHADIFDAMPLAAVFDAAAADIFAISSPVFAAVAGCRFAAAFDAAGAIFMMLIVSMPLFSAAAITPFAAVYAIA